jgi:FixJ family two-component response regulator
MAPEPTVFVVDDDAAVRKSLRWLLDSAALRVETFATAQDFLDAYEPSRPGCLVLDVRLPKMSGLDLQERLVARGIRIPTILITGHGDVPTAVRAMKAGAVDFLEKPVSESLLLDRVRQALRQDAEARAPREGGAEVAARLRQLSAREREVLARVVSGKSSKVIAAELGIAPKTVESIRSRIMKKVGAANAAQLVRLAVNAAAQQPRPQADPEEAEGERA